MMNKMMNDFLLFELAVSSRLPLFSHDHTKEVRNVSTTPDNAEINEVYLA